MSAKSILNKLLGVGSIVLGIIYLLFPEVLLNLLGLPYSNLSFNLVAWVIRILAMRNIVIGIAMLISRKGISEHYWLWVFVISSFSDAIAALFLTESSPARYLIPLWAGAIALLFFVGVAYGLDIAGVFEQKKTEPEVEPVKVEPELIEAKQTETPNL
jgi:hypothetical protein